MIKLFNKCGVNINHLNIKGCNVFKLGLDKKVSFDILDLLIELGFNKDTSDYGNNNTF